MSPRKSSTSSDSARRSRPRYLGLELEGEPVLPSSPRGWEAMLRASWARSPSPVPRFRLIRVEGRRAVVEVGHLDAARARAVWSRAELPPHGSLSTYRTWGTLVGAKRWLKGSASAAERESASSR